jgi:hypothetical protein
MYASPNIKTATFCIGLNDFVWGGSQNKVISVVKLGSKKNAVSVEWQGCKNYVVSVVRQGEI